jgi:hypothetical protein
MYGAPWQGFLVGSSSLANFSSLEDYLSFYSSAHLAVIMSHFWIKRAFRWVEFKLPKAGFVRLSKADLSSWHGTTASSLTVFSIQKG